MERRIAAWAHEIGGTAVDAIVPVAVGLGDTELWRVRRPSDVGDLLFRRFASGDQASARREMVAMRAARAGGVPVPDVLACDIMDDRPALLSTWCAGTTAFEVIASAPAEARSVGARLGEVLGGIHHVTAPARLPPADAWITRGGPALAPLRARLERVPNADRLLHLDYHPRNVMMTPGRVEGVIDWTNTLAGPPPMDLARSRAILRAVAAGGALPDGMLDALHQVEAGLIEGHARVAGADPHPALSAAWGLSMTVEDLRGHLGKPGTWVTQDVLDTLSRERDSLIAAAMNAGGDTIINRG